MSKILKFYVDVRQDLVYASGFPLRSVRPIFKVKWGTKHAYTPFSWFSCSIAKHFLGDTDSDVKNTNIICGFPSIPCLCRWLDISLVRYFKGQTSPEASIPPFRQFSCAIANNFLGDPDSNVKNAKFFVFICQNHIYASNCPSSPIQTIFKVKRAPKRTYPHFDDFWVL